MGFFYHSVFLIAILNEVGALRAVPASTESEMAERTLSYLANKPQTTDTAKMMKIFFCMYK